MIGYGNILVQFHTCASTTQIQFDKFMELYRMHDITRVELYYTNNAMYDIVSLYYNNNYRDAAYTHNPIEPHTDGVFFHEAPGILLSSHYYRVVAIKQQLLAGTVL